MTTSRQKNKPPSPLEKNKKRDADNNIRSLSIQQKRVSQIDQEKFNAFAKDLIDFEQERNSPKKERSSLSPQISNLASFKSPMRLTSTKELDENGAQPPLAEVKQFPLQDKKTIKSNSKE